ARVDTRGIAPLPIFDYLKQLGDLSDEEMYGTFNMGIGLVAALPQAQADGFVKALRQKGEAPVILGDIVKGEAKITL
ncbi:MAG: phosphoribosylformylglycinamidine cyclo-ligase, partial [Ruminococcaceae bacterium]|nr:phosphoribosylformylglycinamidine cyclo-ligase [Oscillospiraceae bacterium]